jgi:hypothetical protein
MTKATRIVLFASVLLVLVLPISAQDSHYWTHHYGTRSTLLGGAVIGSVLDLSGTYYNPGGLSLIETDEVELLMFSKVFHFPTIKMKGFGESKRSLSSSALGESPSLVAGSLPIKGLGNHWLGYSFLNRHQIEFGLSGVGQGKFPPYTFISNDNPGTVDLILYERLSEPWYGVTWAYKISDKFGVGVSNYLSFRSHQMKYQTLIQVVNDEAQVDMIVDARNYSYSSYSLLWKIGLTYDFEQFTLGLTLTTPGLKLYGKGEIGQNRTIIRHDPDYPDYMAVDFQSDLKATYISPLSVGAGVTYKLYRTRFYVTVEWFNGADEYVVMQGEDFTSQSTDKTLPNRLTHEMQAVFNIAVGAERKLSSKVTLYGSFWTDFSARKDESTSNLSVSDWDLFHFMGGASFDILGFPITLGMGYSFGNKTGGRRREVNDPYFDSISQEFLFDRGSSYSSFRWLLGFSF